MSAFVRVCICISRALLCLSSNVYIREKRYRMIHIYVFKEHHHYQRTQDYLKERNVNNQRYISLSSNRIANLVSCERLAA